MNTWLKSGVLLLLITSLSFSQEKLSLEQALAIALKNNFDIRIQNNELEQADNNKLNALTPFLPSLSGNMKVETSTKKEDEFNFATGSRTGNRISVTQDQFQASFGISYNINDIYGAILTYTSRIEGNEQTHATIKANIQQYVYNVIEAYYGLVEQKNIHQLNIETLDTRTKELKREQSRFEIGSISKSDVYTSKTQLNAAKITLLNQEQSVKSAETRLNILLGRNAFDKIDVQEVVIIEKKYSSFDEIKQSLLDNNPSLKAENLKLEVAETDLRKAQSDLYLPKLGVNANYSKGGFGQSNFGDAFEKAIDFSDYFSKSAYIQLSYNLNGVSQYVGLQNAEINLQNVELDRLKKIQDINAELYDVFTLYRNRLEMIHLNEENLIAQQENMRLKQERFNIGSGTSIELKTAQDDLVRSESDLIRAKFNAKLSEVNIDRLLGLTRFK